MDGRFAGIEKGETLASAIRMALGASRDPSVCYSAIRADPLGLGRRYSNAQEVFRGEVMREIWRRAIDGVPEPNHFEGRVISFTRKYSDKLLSDLARRVDPEWLDKRSASDVTTHSDAASSDVLFTIDYSTIAIMPPAIRRSLIPAFEWLKEHVGVKESRELATADVTDVIIETIPAPDDFALTDAQRAGDWT